MAITSTGNNSIGSRLAIVALLALTAAGCQSERLARMDTRPEPLNAAPSGTVTSSTLPPPTMPGANDPSAFPPPPTGTDPTLASTAPNQIAAPPANAPDVTKENLVGAWKVAAGSGSCQMMLSLTKMSADFRAASLRCPGTAAGVAAWNVAGKQVVLKDNGGNTVARLYSSGPERFDGQTSDGQPISFSR
ncbi:MAG: protease inhibitor Inh/omp19 family protein [Mesorhizobium sp.]|nr:protease inhibitor Inh/omp19 family protein [Mesorhizobium sp.]